jgi:uncharacterized protein (DUF305 family)
METKPLLYGLIGFMLGGLLVAIAANTFDKAELQDGSSMNQMTASLETKTGDAYDAAFLTNMIEHHEAAVEMAKLSAKNAKHDEIKSLSREIIAAQEKEISQMTAWQGAWKYSPDEAMHVGH